MTLARPVLAFDTETFLIEDLCKTPRLVCVSWATGGASGLFKWDGDGLARPDALAPQSCTGLVQDGREVVHSLLSWWFSNRQIDITAHNGFYDFGVLINEYPDLLPLVFDALDEGRIYDTMNMQKLRDIALGEFRGHYLQDGSWERYTYKLADLSRRHRGQYLTKGKDSWQLRYGELYNVPLVHWPHDASHYAVLDAVSAEDCHHSLMRERDQLMAHGWPNIFGNLADQNRAAMWLQLCSIWGLKVAVDKVEALAAGVIAERDQIRAMLLEEGLIRAETKKRSGDVKYVRNTKAAAARMVESCGWREVIAPNGAVGYELIDPSDPENLPLKTTEKGNICLNEEACEDTWDPVLEAYAKYTSLENVLGKDVKRLLSGEIHGEYDSLQATGRTSCRGFNTQNLRRKGGTRECFVPRPRYVYCLIDLDTAELRAVAQVCISLGIGSRMAEVINSGKDVHCVLGSELAGVLYETFLAGKEGEYFDDRQTAKNANFGLWGGMRPKRFTSLVLTGLKASFYEVKHDRKLTELARAEKLAKIQRLIDKTTLDYMTYVRSTWLRTWPESSPYLEMHERMCAGGKLTTITQLWSNRIRGGLRYSEACNTWFQALIADAMKSAGWELTKAMYDARRGSVLYGSRIVNFPHDEFISEVPEHLGHECAIEIQRIVLQTVGRYLPDVPPRATPYLARYWSKGGFEMYGTDGRLIPWNGEKKADWAQDPRNGKRKLAA
jgi:hypothetical protein